MGLLYWTALVVVQYGGLALPVGILVMGALCLAFSIFHGLFGWGTARLLSAFGPAGLLGAPFVWVGLEYARAHTFFSFPWTLLGYSQHGLLPFVQVAAFTAVYGVSFLVCAASALLAFLAPGAARVEAPGGGRGTRPPRRRVRGVGALGDGPSRRGDGPPPGRPRPGRHPAGGQVAARERLVERRAAPRSHREGGRLRGAARRLAGVGRALPLRRGRGARHAPPRDGEAAGDLPLLRQRRPRAAGGRRRAAIYVGAKLLDPSGELVARYHKIRLVPFGEYVPLQPLFTLGGRFAAKLVQEVSDFTPGEEATTGVVDGHRVGGFICYEAIFPSLVRRFAAGGAELLVNITNDAWYGTTSAPHQHLAMAAFRAVENRRYLRPGREHRHHRGRGPAGPGPGADPPLRDDGARPGRAARGRDDLLRPPRRPCSPGRAPPSPWPSWPRRTAAASHRMDGRGVTH